jgi:hypothetical protein
MVHSKSFLLATLALATTTAHAQWVNPGPDVRLKPDEFAILAWGPTSGDPAVLKDLKACGFNLAGLVGVNDVDAVDKAGLWCIVQDGSIEINTTGVLTDPKIVDQRAAAIVKKVGKCPAVWAYCLRDEPWEIYYKELGQWADAFRKYAPGAKPYVNLLPNFGVFPIDYKSGRYEQYVQGLVDIVKPAFLSYDHYAMMQDGTVREGYFQNLEQMRRVALKNKLPFWNIILGNSHFTYAEPSDATIRFQVYTSLAYGVRGISYFTYFAPPIGNYRSAAIDQLGNKTPTWDMIRRVNLQIHKLGPTYIKLISVNVFHHPEVPVACNGIATSKYVEKLEGGNLMVGEFEGPGGVPYVMVVNKSLREATAFNVKLKGGTELEIVSPYDGVIRPVGGEDWWLAPGQGALLRLKKG